MKTLKKINDGFIKVSEYVAFVLSAIVCAMIVWWAFKRYVFASEFYGAEELILAIAFWMYFIGAYIATHEDSHISADLFTGSPLLLLPSACSHGCPGSFSLSISSVIRSPLCTASLRRGYMPCSRSPLLSPAFIPSPIWSIL